MNPGRIPSDLDPRTIDSFETIEGVQSVRNELDWYFEAYNTSRPTPRVKQATAAFVGEKQLEVVADSLAQTLRAGGLEDDEEFCSMFERTLRLCLTLIEQPREVRSYKSADASVDDSMSLAMYPFTDKTTLFVYHKHLFPEHTPSDQYGVEAPRNAGDKLSELESGFIRDSQPTP